MLVIEAHRSTIGKIYDTATSLLPIPSFKMNSKGAYFQKRVTSSKSCRLQVIIISGRFFCSPGLLYLFFFMYNNGKQI